MGTYHIELCGSFLVLLRPGLLDAESLLKESKRLLHEGHIKDKMLNPLQL